MVIASQNPAITWEKPPTDWIPEEEPVESTGQPLIAGALSGSPQLHPSSS